MTIEELIAEGERLKRPCTLLKADGPGQPIAWWHHKAGTLVSSLDSWITFDSHAVPGAQSRSGPRYLTLFTSTERLDGVLEWGGPPPEGVPLFAHPIEVIAPIEAVFAFGNERIGTWLAENDWPRKERYNPNFPDRALVESYQKRWLKTYPIYCNDPNAYAALGGWHLPHAEDDWYGLADERLLVLTIKDAEPWVEGWQCRDGNLAVVQRIT